LAVVQVDGTTLDKRKSNLRRDLENISGRNDERRVLPDFQRTDLVYDTQDFRR
jgi:hypothetical protein